MLIGDAFTPEKPLNFTGASYSGRFQLIDQDTGDHHGWETRATTDEQSLTPWVKYPLPLSVTMGELLPIEPQRQAAERLVKLFSRRPGKAAKPMEPLTASHAPRNNRPGPSVCAARKRNKSKP